MLQILHVIHNLPSVHIQQQRRASMQIVRVGGIPHWQPQQEVRIHNFFANRFHLLFLIVIQKIFSLLIGFLMACKNEMNYTNSKNMPKIDGANGLVV